MQLINEKQNIYQIERQRKLKKFLISLKTRERKKTSLEMRKVVIIYQSFKLTENNIGKQVTTLKTQLRSQRLACAAPSLS